MATRKAMFAIALFLALSAIGFAAEPIVQLKNVQLDRIMTAGFTLTRGGDFIIKSTGLLARNNDNFLAASWIIDGKTRKPIWVMDERNTESSGKHGLRAAEETIHLDAGAYELYYYASTQWNGEININGTKDFFDFLGNIFDGNLQDRLDSYRRNFYASIEPKDIGFKEFSTYEPDGKFPNALVQFNKVGDSKYLQQGFKLDKKTILHIYAICEYPSGYDNPADYAWIIDTDSGKKIWTVDRWNTGPAGGARKNRLVDQDIELDKGNYVLNYVTDDSHSYDDFNAFPPYDPLNWGVAVLASDKTETSAFHQYKPEGRGQPLIDMTRAGDNADLSEAFKLDSEMSLRVYCLGEYSSWSHEFADYGWIQVADNGKTVWEMSWRNTEHAGGSVKNRMFDGIITLPKGSYIARYITDDSHSYEDWNDSPPYDPKAWGLSIFPGKDFDKSEFHPIKESEIKKNANILAKMTSLRDNVNRRESFTLDKQTKIHIYAVGEATTDQMFDYGWIVDKSTRRSVWEMTWRNTEPAGGASKNRQFADDIILDPGEYEVHFVTDGSHSFNDWNAARPRDPAAWGITVTLSGK